MPVVYPVPGYYISGIPTLEHDCDGEGLHDLCLASGAFTEEPPDEAEPAEEDPADAGSLSVEE